MNLSTNVGNLVLKNPIIVAAGPWSRDSKTIQKCINYGAGAVVTETIGVETREAIRPRLYNLNGQMCNIKMYSDISVEQWVNEFSKLSKNGAKVIASILATTPSEISYLARKMEKAGADAIEISIASPIGVRSLDLEINRNNIKSLLLSVIEAVKIPVFVKLSYEMSHSKIFCNMLKNIGVTKVTSIDGLKGIIGIDINNMVPLMPTHGGYNGKMIRPISLSSIASLKQNTNFNIIASGGFETHENALEALMIGADAVQLASIILKEGFEVISKVLINLSSWLDTHNISTISEIKGVALRHLKPFEEISTYPLHAISDYCDVSNCDQCIKSCIYFAINRVNNNIEIDSSLCAGCGMCKIVCPNNYIRMEW